MRMVSSRFISLIWIFRISISSHALPSSAQGTVDITFEDLLVFVTGADTVPPLGFLVPCKIEFFDQEQGERRMPYASTCSLTLTLPRGMEDEDQFKDMMNEAIRGSLGFGKV